MNKRVIGKNKLELSPIGLGCMGFSHAYGKPTKKEEAIDIIRQSVEMGYTFFDTAEIYGTQEDPFLNERLVGEALKPYRKDVKIATKFGVYFDTSSTKVPYPILTDAHPEKIRKSIEGSLNRLQTDSIDLYFQHRVDPNVSPEAVAEVMAELMQEGKIKHWGISEVTEDYLRRAHAVCPVTAVENRYSMMARHYEDLFPVLEELEIGLIAFSPLANGFLTGKYSKGLTFDKKYDYRSSMPQFKDENIDKNQELLLLLKTLAKEKDATLGQISLAWMLCKKPWIVPIPGTRKISRLKENIDASNILLSEDEIDKIDATLSKIPMSKVFGVK